MKRVVVACLALVFLAASQSCHSDRQASRESKQQKVEQERAAIKAAIPADSPLVKVDFGMTEGEVENILGIPTNRGSHITGKQFIPFNFAAKDTMRETYYYKGIGRVEFSSGSWGQRNGVVNVIHDPTEPGYRRSK